MRPSPKGRANAVQGDARSRRDMVQKQKWMLKLFVDHR